MRPSFLDDMSWRMAEVYGAVTDRILVNLAKYFPYIKHGKEPKELFEYQARMLAQMGQVNKETVQIIMNSLGGADEALRDSLQAAIMEGLRTEEPKLKKAAELGMLNGAGFIPPEVDAGQMQAFQAFYKQSADKLNLVNTVMLESTESAYRATVSDVVNRVGRTQGIMNVAAGETITGVSSWNTAMHDAVEKMVSNGLTGFIDHAGRRWSPEAYVAMDVRTTMYNTSRAAIWERADEFGADLYQVSSHNGARPLCYPWQGKVISRSDWTGEVEDLDGNKVHVYAQSETSMNEPAGLFQINCKHYPMTFIPGFSTLKGEPQDPEENEQAYEESQQQRALERKLREEKRDLEVLKAQGADPEAIKAQRQKVAKASSDIDDFCEETGRARRRNREYTPVNAKFPPKDSYDPSTFPTTERDKMRDFFSGRTSTVSESAILPNTPQRVEFGELFDSNARAVAENVNERITSLYRIDERLGFVGDVRISRNLPQDMDVFDLHDTYKNLVPAGAQYIPKGNRVSGFEGSGLIEVHNNYYDVNYKLQEMFSDRAAIRARAKATDYFETVADGLEGNLIHEYGHFVADYYGIFSASPKGKAKEFRNWMVSYWRENNEALKSVSLYAASAPDEMFAEAFTQSFDTEHTGNAAYKMSMEIMNRFHEFIGFNPGR